MIRPIHVASLALLAACGGAAPAADPLPSSGAASPAAGAPDTVARTLVRPAAVRDDFLLLDSATADVDGDGAPERVDLAAVVGVDDKGRYLWDDGQQWLVAVRDGADTYPLLWEHIQWGSAAFWIVAEDSAGPPAILVLTGQMHHGGGMRVQKFVFDRARGGYARTGSVGALGYSARYRGPPEGGIFPPTFRPEMDY